MPNQFLSDEFGDIEDYFVTDYWLIDNFVGDSLLTWGSNSYGQLGDFSTTQRNIPVTTFSGGTNWKQISCGNQHTAAIKTDGSLWTWGRNSYGQLGINVYGGNRNTPVTTFAGGTDWKQVSFGREHAAAIKTDGSLWVWGLGTDRQLGINNTDTRSIPVTTFAGGNNWKSVSCGFFHTAAIKTDGTLWIWGQGSNGKLGTNDIGDRIVPVTTFAGGNDWKSVECGSISTAAIKTDGSLWTWGSNAYAQLGIDQGNVIRSIPVTTFAGGTNWKQVSNGAVHVSAIKTDGSLWVWGYNLDGRLGINNITNPIPTPVTTFAGGTNWKSVSCLDTLAAIKTDGTLWTWGPGTSGQLGNNATTDRSTPVTTFAGGNNWKSVSGGNSHAAAIKSGLNVDLSFFPVGFVSDGLALYLDAGNTASYPGTGTTWTDLSGNGNNLTLINPSSISWNNSGYFSTGATGYFSGSGTASIPIGNSNYTMMAWVRQPSSWGSRRGIISIGGFGSSGVSNALRTADNTNVGNFLHWWYSYDLTVSNNNAGLSAGTWFMVTAQFDGTNRRVWANATNVGSDTPGNVHNVQTTAVLLGNGPDPNSLFQGDIAQALIYNRALSATEIQQNFNFSKPRFGL
jgi:alpha-tubulin suppressor-like RCC1 family protein